MKVRDLSPGELRHRAEGDCLVIRTGPFTVRLGSNSSTFLDTWQQCYGPLGLLDPDETCHFRLRIRERKGWRALVNKSQAIFEADGVSLFEPFPLANAFPLYEWGLNWCIANRAHQYLLFHCAVLEKNGDALMMPASPGSGKTTLCTALVGAGWRLLSDEFGIYRHADDTLLPLPRAAPLKNNSIELIAGTAPHLTLGPTYLGTRKGDVAHLFPPEESLALQNVPARPRWVVFPRFEAGTSLKFTRTSPIDAFQFLIHNSFNYRITGAEGFRSVCRLMRSVDVYTLKNGSLDDALASIEGLPGSQPA